MPTQAIGLQESVRHPAAADSVISMKEAVVVEDGRHKMREVLAARVVEVGAARTTVDTAVKAISSAAAAEEDRTEVVEEDMVVLVLAMDNNLEPTEAATTHKVRAAGTASKARTAGTISKLRVVHMVSQRRATIPTGNKAAMILSLVLEHRTSRRHRFFSRYPIASLSLQLSKEGG